MTCSLDNPEACEACGSWSTPCWNKKKSLDLLR
jgi:hypothetical protein